jgi:hypothetical protein
MTDNSIEALIQSAKQHGLDSEPDHEVGDLQQFLRIAWAVMTPAQAAIFMDNIEPWRWDQ